MIDFDEHPLFMFARLLAEAVLRTLEDASRTREGRFRYRISLPYRKSLFFTPTASEDASRTRGGCFAHRMSTPYHRRAFPVPSPQRQLPPASKYPSIAQRAPCSNRQTGQRVSVREIRYQKQTSTVRNTHSVFKKASWGTRRIFGSIRCKKQAFLVREGYSVPETASYGTRRIFKGALNSLLLHRMHFRKRKNGILLH